MANEIKELFSATSGFTITLSGLASSTSGVGRQSNMVDNSVARASRVFVFVKAQQGSSTPTSARGVYVYGIRGDGTYRDDGAGAVDAPFTGINSPLLGVLANKAAGAATGDYVQGWMVFDNPGKEFGIAISHDTGVNLGTTEANHAYKYVLDNPEVQ